MIGLYHRQVYRRAQAALERGGAPALGAPSGPALPTRLALRGFRALFELDTLFIGRLPGLLRALGHRARLSAPVERAPRSPTNTQLGGGEDEPDPGRGGDRHTAGQVLRRARARRRPRARRGPTGRRTRASRRRTRRGTRARCTASGPDLADRRVDDQRHAEREQHRGDAGTRRTARRSWRPVSRASSGSRPKRASSHAVRRPEQPRMEDDEPERHERHEPAPPRPMLPRRRPASRITPARRHRRRATSACS